MGIALAHGRVEGDFLEGLDDPALALAPIEFRVMDAQPFADDLADGQARRERAEGVLEDDLQARTQRAHAGAIQGGKVAVVEADVAAALEQA